MTDRRTSGSSGSSRAAGANNAENDGSGGLFRRSQVRVHACPDVAIGWRGSIAGGERDDDLVAVELDVQSALVPAGGRARHTAGLHYPRQDPARDGSQRQVRGGGFPWRRTPTASPFATSPRGGREEVNRRKKDANRRSGAGARTDGTTVRATPRRPRRDARVHLRIPGADSRRRRGPTGPRDGSHPAIATGTIDVRTPIDDDDDDDDDDGEMDAAVLKAAAATVVEARPAPHARRRTVRLRREPSRRGRDRLDDDAEREPAAATTSTTVVMRRRS